MEIHLFIHKLYSRSMILRKNPALILKLYCVSIGSSNIITSIMHLQAFIKQKKNEFYILTIILSKNRPSIMEDHNMGFVNVA